MPPPFPLYLLISSAFAAGFFVLLGVILTALVRWNTADPLSPAALSFYGAFLFVGVLRVIKDAWAYWPYAFHSAKFLRRPPAATIEAGPQARTWLRLSPGLMGAGFATLILALCAYVTILLFASPGTAPATAALASGWQATNLPGGVFFREVLFWLPATLLIPAALFVLMFGFGVLFVRSYARFEGQPRSQPASRAVVARWVLPEAFAFLILNAAILWPLGDATVFQSAGDVDAFAIASGLFSGASLVAFSTSALWLSIVAPATPALTGAVFSRLWRLEGIEDLRTPRPLPDAGQFSFRFRDYFAPVFALNFAIFGGWYAATAMSATAVAFAWFLIPAELVWLAAFAYFRRRVLAEDLQRVQEFYRQRPYFYTPGPALKPAELPAELAA